MMSGRRQRQATLSGVLLLLLTAAMVGPGLALPRVEMAPAAACPEDRVPTAGFTDTQPPHDVSADCLAWYRITLGTSATTFSPGRDVTRGQTATFVVRLLDELDDVVLPDRDRGAFPDVTGGPHQSAIETLTAVSPAVLRGFADGSFRPSHPVTRGQFASILVRSLDEVAAQHDDLDPLAAAGTTYPDAVGSTHEDAIARLSNAGVIVGFVDGTFRPARAITRGQVATMLARAMGGLTNAGLLQEPDWPDLSTPVSLTEVASMGSPTAGALGPDGTLYLAERSGTVHPLTGDGAGDAVLDLSAETTTGGERGLLGLAFAADGSELYASFTDLDGDTVVEAFAVDDGQVVPGQRRTVYTLDQPAANHNGGDVQIGPDGYLYLGLGDGGSSGTESQDLFTPLGSLIRIDPLGGDPYAVPADNPFVGDALAADEIYAYGLRNPWRFSFDEETGDLWIADVGQNDREEVNVGPYQQLAGANFGWNLMEGTLEFAGPEPDDHVPPVFEYETRGPIGCAITGGYVYRGAALADLAGAYLFSDYCGGGLHAIVVRGGEVVDQAQLASTGERVVSFVRDADGELYVLGLDGPVLRIDPA